MKAHFADMIQYNTKLFNKANKRLFMSIDERDYNRDGYSGGSGGGGGGGGVRLSLPPLTPVVKWLLIINFSIFIISFLVKPLGAFLDSTFAVSTDTVFKSLQLWRIVTYQFLHANPSHIIFNMLMLYFFGPTLENLWRSKRFLIFYLVCGAVGGLVFPILYYIHFPGVYSGTVVGASGSLLGILAATAVLYPRTKVYIFGIIPVTMVVLVGIVVLYSAYTFLSGQNVAGELCHFSGLATGAIYVLWQPWLHKTRTKVNNGKWEKKITQERELYVSVDQILDKVHKSGMKSLTRKEKQILKQATEKEQGK
jgi:membrane associated rhomboid family serine protease